MTGISNEEQLLDIEFRKILIEEIKGQENVRRKKTSLKAYEIYKDKVKKWVIAALSAEFSEETVHFMKTRTTNINFLKKVVNKLAQAYNAGVKRTGENDDQTKRLTDMEKALKFNLSMRKADRTVVRSKNAYVHIVPKLNYRESIDKPRYDLTVSVYAPHAYDVIPDASNQEIGRVVILTDFLEGNNVTPQPNLGPEGRSNGYTSSISAGNNKEETIATVADDKGAENREYIFWSDRYHFTCNDKGEILSAKSPEGLLNPIGKIPGRFLSEDKDGFFWAEGGDDLVDGAILLNVELTDLECIKSWQGWGQAVLTGKIKDKNIKFGPNRLLLLPHEDASEPKPEFAFYSSNPPLDQHMSSIEMHTALYLSTNNLSPTNVAGKLDATSFPSGIAKMVEDAQSTEPLEERQAYYQEQEPEAWEIIKDWQNLYFDMDALTEKFKAIGKFEDGFRAKIEFLQTKQVITEGEKLDNLQKRKNIGINTRLDLIMKDNPDLTKEQAEAKLAELESEDQKNLEKQQELIAAGSPTQSTPSKDEKIVSSTTKGNPASKKTEGVAA